MIPTMNTLHLQKLNGNNMITLEILLLNIVFWTSLYLVGKFAENWVWKFVQNYIEGNEKEKWQR